MSDSSFAKIDYSIRPAKFAERKMLTEIFRNVRPFQSPAEYLYVGLGSVWFSDFSLFHRHIGVKEMISIEREINAQQRVEDNKPFKCISVKFKESSAVLPTLPWNRRLFIWLDYDDQITPDGLLDARTIASHAVSGTLFAVSVQCQKAREINEANQDPQVSALERFNSRFGRNRVAQDTLEDQLTGWSFGELARGMLSAEIDDALALRNVQLPENETLRFEPICDFQYSDNAKMTTLVGMFVAKKDGDKFKECNFKSLDFMPRTGRLVDIKMPLLTIREIRSLERQLPKIPGDHLALGSIPATQAKQYAAFYRYFPNFAIIEP